jgi:hypothetical protein
VNAPALPELHDDEATLDVLFVPPWRFHGRPQVGIALHFTWREFAHWLSQPTIGEAKDVAGAWSPALYHDEVRRKAALVRAHALVVDVDDNGDVDRVADVLSRYRAIVHSTFSATPEAPRCRLVLALTEAVDAATYEAAHAVVRKHLRAGGIVADEGAKDASRVSYVPVVRAAHTYRYRLLDGAALDARSMLAAQPPPPAHVAPRPPTPEHADAYVRAALRRAADSVAGSSPGTRHYALSREAFTLARLGVSDMEIEHALLPAFIASAGEGRGREGVRTIRDAIRARRGAA